MDIKYETGRNKCVGCFGAANNDCRFCPFFGKQRNLDNTKCSAVIFLPNVRVRKGAN